MRDKIFVSYRDDVEGRTHKNLLVAWSENKSFPEVSFMIIQSELLLIQKTHII